MNNFDFELLMKKLIYFFDKNDFTTCLNIITENENDLKNYISHGLLFFLKLKFDESYRNNFPNKHVKEWVMQNITVDYLKKELRKLGYNEKFF